MIEVFKQEKLKFSVRFFRKIGLNIIYPILLLVVLLFTGVWSIVTYKEPLFYLYPVYLTYFIVSNAIMTRRYVWNIEFDEDSGDLLLNFSNYNKEIESRFPKEAVEIQIFQYGIYSRTRNYYLNFLVNEKSVIRQFDYRPWDYTVMKEVVKKYKELKR